MLKFNNTDIFTGYIKQLLSSFNLPSYRIYTKENSIYLEEHGEESPEIIKTYKKGTDEQHMSYVNYIKNNRIQYYDGAWHQNYKLHYHYNKKQLNQTKNLVVKNNVYDIYTHEYLGNFLRFMRDYSNIDLMPLYNCFSNNICSNLSLTFGDTDKKYFKTSDKSYKIYMIPAKLFKKYTLAIDCPGTVEICCGFYDKYLDERNSYKSISTKSYKKYTHLLFNSPILYEGLTYDSIGGDFIDNEYAKDEKNLKIFLKVPQSNNSSIVLLEGDYTSYNDQPIINTDGTDVEKWSKNKAILNFNEEDSNLPDIEERNFKAITDLQLLKANTGISYPFADRLIEYLSGNVICNQDTLEDNTKRVQSVFGEDQFSIYGAWSNKIRMLIYDYMTNNLKYPEANHDILGFVDKDAEKYVSINGQTIENVDIYPDMYKESKNNTKEDK